MKVRDRVVWVTGASSGIGEALSLELGRRGARVALSARRADLLQQLASRIIAAGGQAAPFPADVEDAPSLLEATRGIKEWAQPVDILVANAGTHIPSYPQHFDATEYARLMSINYIGMLNSLAAVVPEMVKRQAGQIVGVASLAGFRGAPSAAAYGASKAAMTHFLESARFHLKRERVQVTIVHPGFVKTPLTDKNNFFMPFLLSAERAAQVICDGIERDRKEIAFPLLFSWALKLGRVLPYPVYEQIVGTVCRSLLDPAE